MEFVNIVLIQRYEKDCGKISLFIEPIPVESDDCYSNIFALEHIDAYTESMKISNANREKRWNS